MGTTLKIVFYGSGTYSQPENTNNIYINTGNSQYHDYYSYLNQKT